MKKILTLVFISTLFTSLLASDARVISMGRSDNFFMDDISIYRNPANINIYPNMMLGSIGFYSFDPALDDTSSSDKKQNRDPQKPYFGGIVSYSLNRSDESVKQYPMISFAAVLNRYDPLLEYLDETNDKFFGEVFSASYQGSKSRDSIDYIKPLGKVDVMAGFTLKNGTMIGVGAYIAMNNELDLKTNARKNTKLIKGNVGLNMPVTKAIDLEVSANVSMYSKIGTVRDSLLEIGIKSYGDSLTVARNDIGLQADVRVFSALSALNGDIVPHVGIKFLKFHEGNSTILGFNGGIGLNLYIDRGFFWTGIEGEYEDNDYRFIDTSYQEVKEINGRISFGIERNVLWDWFVIRAGGSKNLIYRKVGGNNGYTYWSENPEADASDGDQLGIGVGVNVENRLKIDLTVAEDIFYTFSNLFAGNQHHLFTRIDASFSF